MGWNEREIVSKRKKITTKNEPETAILITARNGVAEIVEKILELVPVAIHDVNAENKNALLLAVENRQPHIYKLLLERNTLNKDSVFLVVDNEGKKITTKNEPETAILIAARNGVAEIVEKILELVPVAIHDVNAENKNAVLLAVENRQPHVYKLLLQRNILNRDSVFRVVDKEGNSAFHLAAKLAAFKPWLIPGEALQMQWEMKWYEFVTSSIPPNFVPRYNKERETPEEVFIKTHRTLLNKGSEWLTKTSQSYSVVAALIATVAFATSTTVPGGLKQDTGIPTLENKPAFQLFAISSLVALCFSVTALVMFLSILTSRNQERDFGKDLPRKLLIGLTSLFFSIAAVLISFCSGHFFVVQNNVKYVAFAVYAATCLPITFFAAVQFPLYFDLIHATFTKVPRRSYKATL
ncbi:ankyrin repeat-containing protein ITN1-like [Juglans microcarpa x Juglans regia]|uniref:ankyrin repeat-containing protein ITN1-like n=1 Tax=Juglans microcarpa x Juglans regia TaxID=2249226 RepID=UPI001B7ED914|nr:ankyrin repeat-containing protein ITN1-like [Juglans microcarpa x Juglans regia]